MTPDQARAQYNFLLTLCIRKAEAFGPLAFAFIKDHDLNAFGLTPEEQFNLLVATAEAFAEEPKRYTHKLDCLQKALEILPATSFFDPELARQLQQDIQRLKAELDLYSAAMRPERPACQEGPPQRIVVETDMPDYYLSIAQQRAAAYYQEKYRLTKESKIAQHFTVHHAQVRAGDHGRPEGVPRSLRAVRCGENRRVACHVAVRPQDQPITRRSVGRRLAHLVRQDRIFISASL